MKFSHSITCALIGVGAIAIVQPIVAETRLIASLQETDEQGLADMAKDVTVVVNGQNPGSGVIISKQGNTYYVLTAKHVVATPDQYEIVTSDAQQHPLNYSTVKKLPGVDLALVQFTSDKNYRLAHLGDSDKLSEGATVYIAGWPHPGRAITERIYQLTKGSISGRPLKPLEDGYALVYTNTTRSGMSGGPIFDAQGNLIGIHGRAEGEAVYNPDTGDTVDVKSGFNLGLPINSFLNLSSQGGINLLYSQDNFALTNSFSGHTERVIAVAISPDGQTLASGSSDTTIKIWNRSNGSELRTLTGHSNHIFAVTFSPDGKILASGSAGGTIKIWNISSGELLHTLKGDRDYVFSVAISANGQTLATGSAEDSNIKIWNLQSGQLLRTLKGHSDYVNAVAFSADGKTLASGSSDKTVKIWNAGTGELLRTLSGHSNVVKSVAISPFGQILASSSYSSKDIIGPSDNGSDSDQATIKIWNSSTGDLLHTLTGHSRTVSSVAIDPYGHILASGSYDGTIKIWNLYTGQLLHTLEVPSAKGNLVAVSSVAFTPDGQTLVSGGDDATIKIWQVGKR